MYHRQPWSVWWQRLVRLMQYSQSVAIWFSLLRCLFALWPWGNVVKIGCCRHRPPQTTTDPAACSKITACDWQLCKDEASRRCVSAAETPCLQQWCRLDSWVPLKVSSWDYSSTTVWCTFTSMSRWLHASQWICPRQWIAYSCVWQKGTQKFATSGLQ